MSCCFLGCCKIACTGANWSWFACCGPGRVFKAPLKKNKELEANQVCLHSQIEQFPINSKYSWDEQSSHASFWREKIKPGGKFVAELLCCTPICLPAVWCGDRHFPTRWHFRYRCGVLNSKVFPRYYWTLYSACSWQMPVSILALISFVRWVSPIMWNMKVDKNSPWSMQIVAAWMRILLNFLISYVSKCSPTSWPSLPMASRSATETQDADFVILLCPDFGQMTIYLYTPTSRSWWSQWVSHVSLSHLFVIVMKVMVWHFVSGSHKVMAALAV